MTINVESIDAGIADLEKTLAELKRQRASISASSGSGGQLTAAQLESREYLTLVAQGISVRDAAGRLKPFETISAAIEAKFANLTGFERENSVVDRIRLKRMAENLARNFV